MGFSTVDLSDPLSSGEFATLDMVRMTEIDRRHSLIREFLEHENYAALLLQQPANFAWLTGGGLNQRGGMTGNSGCVFVTPDARLIACSNADTAQFFESDVAGLGFQLKERPWFEPRAVMVADLCRGRRVASDTGVNGTDEVSQRLLGMRLPLNDYDIEHIREAGRLLTHGIEATARAFTRGRTEAEVAGELSHRLLKRGVTPERIQILGDGRGRRFRYWNHDQSTVQRYCTISVVGRYHGLYVGAARTVSIGDPPNDLLVAFEQAALVAATPEVLGALADLDVETRAAVIHHARRTAQGMRTFVERSDARGGLRLASLPELRSYCYVVAGIVGELLTDLFVLHSPEAARHEIERALRDNAVAFGEGLQLVNILKDATDDARDGRAYLPADTPRSELLSLARHDLHRAVRYVSALQVAGAPRGYVEFTALPVILAFATLDVVAHEGPGAKLSRATVLEAVRALDERLDAGLPAVGAP